MIVCATIAAIAATGLSDAEYGAAQQVGRPKSAVLAKSTRSSRRIVRLWFLLSMVPTILLAAITNKLTTDVSPVPFLWVAPLTIYIEFRSVAGVRPTRLCRVV